MLPYYSTLHSWPYDSCSINWLHSRCENVKIENKYDAGHGHFCVEQSDIRIDSMHQNLCRLLCSVYCTISLLRCISLDYWGIWAFGSVRSGYILYQFVLGVDLLVDDVLPLIYFDLPQRISVQFASSYPRLFSSVFPPRFESRAFVSIYPSLYCEWHHRCIFRAGMRDVLSRHVHNYPYNLSSNIILQPLSIVGPPIK